MQRLAKNQADREIKEQQLVKDQTPRNIEQVFEKRRQSKREEQRKKLETSQENATEDPEIDPLEWLNDFQRSSYYGRAHELMKEEIRKKLTKRALLDEKTLDRFVMENLLHAMMTHFKTLRLE